MTTEQTPDTTTEPRLSSTLAARIADRQRQEQERAAARRAEAAAIYWAACESLSAKRTAQQVAAVADALDVLGVTPSDLERDAQTIVGLRDRAARFRIEDALRARDLVNAEALTEQARIKEARIALDNDEVRLRNRVADARIHVEAAMHHVGADEDILRSLRARGFAGETGR